MSNQSKRKQAELFMKYPLLWEQTQRLIKNGKLPEMNIRVTRADTTTMDYRLDEMPLDGRGYKIAMQGPFENLRGAGRDILLAVDAKHNVLAQITGNTSRINPVYVRYIFEFVPVLDLVDYLILLETSTWHKEPTEEEAGDDITFGEHVGSSLDVYILLRPTEVSWIELRDQTEALRKEREEAYLHPPKEMPKLDGLEQALRDGCRLRAFRSGGGLRVVSLTKAGKSVGYGEHYDITEALRHADEDFLAGGREYKDVYGAGKLYPHHLTGSSTAASNLDLWVLQGHTIDAWTTRRRKTVVVRLKGYKEFEHPEGLNHRVLAGETVRWEDRGFTYESTKSQLPNGDDCVSTQVVAVAEGVDPRDDWMYRVEQTGRGTTFWEAALAALEAEAVPVARH
jgi:hypothetical protein